METTTRPSTPLRQTACSTTCACAEFAERTQAAYILAVCKLAPFLGRSPDTASTEDLRCFQLHLGDAGTGPLTLNATITGLK